MTVQHRVGLGFDVHPFALADTRRPLVLGGVVIEGSPALAGHSDADAVAHAVADALLGPSGLGDLGTLFPSSDERYRGADSMQLLADVAVRVHGAGWRVDNIDVVIAAEAPKLAPFVDAMARNVASALDAVAPTDDTPVFVSVTPKRGEGLGFVGRAEGIAAWAVAQLVR
ncbi:MAG TPA: 2-C-methyl-D-erythritol 2,4-cyclodiphosphate synthase [Acidimicrobiia bacterium]|jgi:2-C-methyl-D-erythritol 2,4-cyclodiphosphate synthase